VVDDEWHHSVVILTDERSAKTMLKIVSIEAMETPPAPVSVPGTTTKADDAEAWSAAFDAASSGRGSWRQASTSTESVSDDVAVQSTGYCYNNDEVKVAETGAFSSTSYCRHASPDDVTTDQLMASKVNVDTGTAKFIRNTVNGFQVRQ